MRRERCLCGGWIEAESVESCDGPMHWHVASLTHQIWRGVQEGRFPGSGQRPTAFVPRDLSGLCDGASAPAVIRRLA